MCQTLSINGGDRIETISDLCEIIGYDNLICHPEYSILDLLRTQEACLCGVDLVTTGEELKYDVSRDDSDLNLMLWSKPAVTRIGRAAK